MIFIRRWYFLIISFLALSVYIAQRLDFWLPYWMNNYFNDLLCMPIVLKICQFAIRYIKGDDQRKVPIFLQIGLTIYYSIYFEYLLPQFNDRYTTDKLDIIFYFLGLLLFQWLERDKICKTYTK